ncbi:MULTISPECIES: hypothetical protein [Enterobacter]|uniref:Uncharacterized protein n=1 Tax=Enterobacter pasteurii TaxID=3029761 RepID=A0ABR9QAJ8_9ENTR|nr:MULTISPECIES: hypothetical protein [Enterobacter]MCM7512283.1 hypothetical protein [Enterobacter hormaechei]MBE4855842.1 hypothetical protein [Enterobacter pasteurii]MBE4864907.1 hypothetical protein [Enterobacter cloacae complex sp. P40C2]MBE4876069.1 hypothetical protein [Enterobacter cloacae complex sp. P40C]MCI2291600.1 hypothetical protein [Enterobacter sp. I4]
MLVRFSGLLLFFISFHALSLNFSSTVLRLNCPERGPVEIILHVYDHTQEKWSGNFETGAGHKRSGDTEIIPFANGDILFHSISRDTFSYLYDGESRLRYCAKLDERPVYPSF